MDLGEHNARKCVGPGLGPSRRRLGPSCGALDGEIDRTGDGRGLHAW